MSSVEVQALYPRRTGLLGQLIGATGSVAEAEDVVQEAFVRGLDHPARLLGADNPKAWPRTVAVNLARCRWRRVQRLVGLAPRLVEEPPEADTNGNVVLLQALRRRSRQPYAAAGLRRARTSGDSSRPPTRRHGGDRHHGSDRRICPCDHRPRWRSTDCPPVEQPSSDPEQIIGDGHLHAYDVHDSGAVLTVSTNCPDQLGTDCGHSWRLGKGARLLATGHTSQSSLLRGPIGRMDTAATDEIGAALRSNRPRKNQREGTCDHEADDHHEHLC